MSLVVYVAHAGRSFLFAGDAEWEDRDCTPAIQNMPARFTGSASALLDVDVYKVGHHGSRNGTNRALLRALTPEVSVLTTGHHSVRAPTAYHAYYYRHPRERVVRDLQRFTTGRRDQPTPAYSMPGTGPRVPGEFTMRKAVYCSCWDGDIVVSVSDGGELTVETEH